jgi:predicted nucleic acid-binding protein
MPIMTDAWLVDTNVVLRWAHVTDPKYPLVSNILDRLRAQGETLFVTPQNLIEFWNVSTRPLARNGRGLRPAEADEALARVEGYFYLAEDMEAVYRVWRRLVVEHAVSGVQVHDARIAAVMQVHEITRILTFNTRDFARYTGIQPVHPEEIAAGQ